MTWRLQSGLFALLLCVFLASNIQALPSGASAQSTSATESWTEIIQAFQSVQKANTLGAPSQQIIQLTAELNKALEYYGNSTQLRTKGDLTGSDSYARLSNSTAASVLSKALVLQSEAESRRANGQAIAYFAAIIASMISTLLVMEYHRIPNFLRKRKGLRTRLR